MVHGASLRVAASPVPAPAVARGARLRQAVELAGIALTLVCFFVAAILI